MRKYMLLILVCILSAIAVNFFIQPTDLSTKVTKRQVGKGEILGMLQKEAQIATTQVKIRRMGFLDPDSEEPDMTKPKTWKIGKRGCLVPVDITIEYGIDLTEMNESDIVIDSGNVVRIKLPKAKKINTSYDDRTNPKDVIRINNGMRDEIGSHTIQNIKLMVYEEVKEDSLIENMLQREIVSNTKTLFRSMLKGMGLIPEFN